jgi:hypothetical protein
MATKKKASPAKKAPVKAAAKKPAAKAAAKEEHLADCRENLAEAILDYAEAIFGKDLSESYSIDSIVEIFEEFEKDMKELDKALAFAKAYKKEMGQPLGEVKNKIKVTTHSIDDDDIIARFLKSLK